MSGLASIVQGPSIRAKFFSRGLRRELSSLCQQRPGGARVTDRGLLGLTGDLGEVERVRAVNRGYFELAVDTEPFQRGGLTAECRRDGHTADGPGLQRAVLVDQ